ncbi:MAG TPA: hypothetical protein VGM86_07560 [Thermoanaerobaculia bacterium]|jgi:hypothetical protein
MSSEHPSDIAPPFTPAQEIPPPVPPAAEPVATAPGPVAAGACPGGRGQASFVYAMGTIQVRYPNLGVEREVSQAVKALDSAHLTDPEVLHQILADHRYLAREVCWVMAVEGIEVYVLIPRDGHVLDQLVEAIRPAPPGLDCDVVIGTRGALAPPAACGGLVLPTVLVDQVYSFEITELIAALPRPEGVEERPFRAGAEELYRHVLQMADNVGSLDEHRALNYLAVRYPRLYELTAEMLGRESTLSGVEVRPSRLSGSRRLLDAVLSYTHRKTDVTERYYVRVDVTEKYPFLASKLAPFYDR